jgi:hypothetical protein
MSDAVSFAEINEQQIELLPQRTVMSMIFQTQGGQTGGNGGDGKGGIGANLLSGIGILAEGTAGAGNGSGGAGGAINPTPTGP